MRSIRTTPYRAIGRTARLCTAACLALLAGCANADLPALVFDDGPGPATPAQAIGGPEDQMAVLTGQRPVRRIDPGGEGYPSLGSVPPRPAVASSPLERQALLDRLVADRAQADTLTRTLEAVAPKPPTQVPADPVLPAEPPPAPEPVTGPT